MKNGKINRRVVGLIMAVLSAGTMYGITAAKGVFSVSSTKTVQFATAPELELVQWSTAYEWRESNKNADGHFGWYILDHNEWTYLLVTRDGEEESKNNLCTVDGKYGLVILPDGWVKPDGVEYAATPLSYGTNIYTSAQWEKMKQSGAVFLPCHGYSTDGETIIDADIHGRYWASDEAEDDSSKGYNISMEEATIHDQNKFSKIYYYSVILVREVPDVELDEDDDLAKFTDKLDDADDHDYAYVHRTLKKDGTLYTLCLPFDVPDIEASPLAGAEMFTFDGGTVSGSTGNEQLHLNLSRLTGKRLTQGVPYILRWAKTTPVETLSSLYFEHVENWDANTDAATDPGNETVKFHGVYPKAHIPGYTSGAVAHYNFFLGANNTLYWPDDATYGNDREMKGFRAYFYIVHDPDPDPAPAYRNMPVVWNISGAFGGTTGIQNTEYRKQTQKLLRNGQVVLIIDGKQFDLQGKQIK